jgi:hypothetical protein
MSILESSRHELGIAHGLTLMTLSLRGWEVLPTLGALTRTRITWAFFTIGATSHGCHSGIPLVPMVFWASLLKRCATLGLSPTNYTISFLFNLYFVYTSYLNIVMY